jgi:hypothetical protein
MTTRVTTSRRCKRSRPLKPSSSSRFCACLPAQVARLAQLKAKIDADVHATAEPDRELLARQRMAEVRLKSTRQMARALCKVGK